MYMEKQFNVSISCPKCEARFNTVVQQTVYGETPGNIEKIMDNRLNVATCPHCSYSFRVPVSVMYADQFKRYAVWYEPIPDPLIEQTSKIWAQMLGDFYSKAPRISDWQLFKETIKKFESGELTIPSTPKKI